MEEDPVHVESGRGLVLVAKTHEAEFGEDSAAEDGIARPEVEMSRVHGAVEKSYDVFRKCAFLDVPHVEVFAVGVARLDHVEVWNCAVLGSWC